MASLLSNFSKDKAFVGASIFLGSIFLTRLVAGFRSVSKARVANAATSAGQPAGTTATPKTREGVPVVDIDLFFVKEQRPEEYAAECKKVAHSLRHYGTVVLKDSRVREQDNNTFLDMIERYFGQSDGTTDARPQHSYQVGVTPAGREVPRDNCDKLRAFAPENASLTPCPPEADPKWRFFWRVGPRPEHTKFKSLNMEPVIPENFPEWTPTMDMWGTKMLDALFVIAEMAAIGFDLPRDAFTSRMHFGPHLLAPTGSDLGKYGALNTVLAGYHYDLNFLTIHGKSRFPGLFAWLRDGTKVPVVVPDGCLLVQAGKQIEYLTGGHVLAGYHEVVVSERTLPVIEKRKAEGKSLWRVSSTCFGHIASDVELQPLAHFANAETLARFPPRMAGDQVMDELNAIKLGKDTQFTLNKN